MVPLLENYALAAVLLTGAILYALFFFGIRTGNPLTMLLVVVFTLIPVAGVAEQALVTVISVTIAVGIAVGGLVGSLSHAFFPDAPGAAAKAVKAPPPSRETAGWIALRGMMVVMPVFVLALTDPSFYLAAIMKTAALGQQAGSTDTRSAGKELVGSTLMGAAMALVVWCGLSLWPNLWMLLLWMMAAALWAGARLFGVRRTAFPPVFWNRCADDHADPARSGDRGQRRRHGGTGGVRRPCRPVRRRRALCLGDGLAARTLARLEKRGPVLPQRLKRSNGMILMNLAIGLLTMMGCLIVQVSFTFWSVRYAVRQAEPAHPGPARDCSPAFARC
jgi:hypothetical protein